MKKIYLFVFVLSFLIWSPKVFATTPTVETLGDGTTDYVLPISEEPNVYSADLVFNVVIDQDSKTAVEDALYAAASNSNLGFTWVEVDDAYSTVTVANLPPVIFDEDVIVEVTEYVEEGEGDSAEVTLIDSDDETPVGDIIYAGGDGSEETPFLIETCEQLQNVNYFLNGNYFTLNDDVDCSETSTWNSDGDESYYGFMPIGSTYDYISDVKYGNGFSGVFDGNNHTISDLYINRQNFGHVGLFGTIGGSDLPAILIKDLTIENADITAYDYTGVLIGDVYPNSGGPSVISNVHTSGEITIVDDLDGGSGGLVGNIYESEITGSSATVTISGENTIGGLVGFSTNSEIEDSHASGTVSGTPNVGGLIGYNSSEAPLSVENCYATGAVHGTTNVGGLVGYNVGNDISLSYSTGDVSGTGYVGGLVGYNDGGEITTSYATGDMSGVSRIGGLIGYNRGHIENTYATGNVTGNGRIGGLVGQTVGESETPPTIVNSYATGTVMGNQYVGGLVGQDDYDHIYNSFSVGMVSGGNYTGGLVGYFDGDGDSYTDYIYNSGWYQSNPNLHGIGYDTDSSTFAEVDYTETDYQEFYSSDHGVYGAGEEGEWDFEEVWSEQAHDYPLLTNNLEDRVVNGGEEELNIDFTRISVTSEGEEVDASSSKYGGSYDMSEDGRYVAFVSYAALTPDVENGNLDAYIYDTEEGTIERLYAMVDFGGEIEELEFSCGSGIFPPVDTCYVSLSDNGRYAVVGGAFNSEEGYYGMVIILDRNNPENVKFVTPDGVFVPEEIEEEPVFDFLPYPSLSGDGSKLVVSSPLIDGLSSIYYYDIGTEEIVQTDDNSFSRASISKDGNYITAITPAPYVEEDTNDMLDIYVFNTADIISDPENFEGELISLKPNGEQFTEDDNIFVIFAPFVSEDGRYVAFSTYTIDNPPTGYSTVYLRDRQAETTTEIYQSDIGLLNSYVSSMSNDGQFLVFASSAFTSGAPFGNSPVFIYDADTEDVTTLVPGMSHNSATISGDGHFISFASNSSSLVDDDTNDAPDVFLMENPFYEADLCPNIAGIQTTVPRGKYLNRAGNCVARVSSGSSAGGTSTVQSQAPTVPTTPEPENDPSCLLGYLYSPMTGKLCPTVALCEGGACPKTEGQNPPNNQGENTNQQTPNIERILKLTTPMMRGDDVKALQIYLNNHNYNCGIADGIFGLKTKQAVINFQLAHSLVGDGVVGPLTKALLK